MKLTFTHATDGFAGFVRLLRLAAAHVHAVAEDVAYGAGGGLQAACGRRREDVSGLLRWKW